jgi:hypothetical protein
MGPSYRLLALDLDGTLLRRDHRVDERDVAAIAELQRAGVVVTIVTGRLQSGAIEAGRACAIEGAIGCADGSHLVELGTGATLAHHGIGAAEVGVLRDAFGAAGLASFVFDATGIHCDGAGADYVSYVRTWSPNLRVVEDGRQWDAEPLCAVAVGGAAAIAAAHAALRAHAATLFAVSFPVSAAPGQHAVLARAAGVTKGTALAAICAAAGCSLAEAVAVGDWLNDVPMFEVAGRALAMGDAPASVRAAATDVLTTAAGAGGGIAEAIRRVWG